MTASGQTCDGIREGCRRSGSPTNEGTVSACVHQTKRAQPCFPTGHTREREGRMTNGDRRPERGRDTKKGAWRRTHVLPQQTTAPVVRTAQANPAASTPHKSKRRRSAGSGRSRKASVQIEIAEKVPDGWSCSPPLRNQERDRSIRSIECKLWHSASQNANSTARSCQEAGDPANSGGEQETDTTAKHQHREAHVLMPVQTISLPVVSAQATECVHSTAV